MATTKRLLEVEQKFIFHPTLVPRFRSNTGTPPFTRLESLGTRSFTDTYLDCNNLPHNNTLAANGIYIRQRRTASTPTAPSTITTLEAKLRISGSYTRSTFREIHDDRRAIAELIRPHVPPSVLDERADNLGLGTLARFTTTRDEFRADGRFAVVLDWTDFGHAVGEVEVMAEDGEGEGVEEKAHREIDSFMKRYGWFFGKGNGKGGLMVEGKLAAYLRMQHAGGGNV